MDENSYQEKTKKNISPSSFFHKNSHVKKETNNHCHLYIVQRMVDYPKKNVRSIWRDVLLD
jgi:hypothetical protein